MADLTLKNLSKNVFFILAIVIFIISLVYGKFFSGGPSYSIIKIILNLSVPVLFIVSLITESKK